MGKKFIVLLAVIISCIFIPLQRVSGFELKGFSDLTYQYSSSDKAADPLKNGSFMMGGLDFFAAHNITDRLDVLSEVVFEAPAGDMIVDVERIEVGYAFGDWLNIRMGRFHTPVGYYANMYHHGRHMDSTISRPLVLEFEDAGGLVPAHEVGLWARGNINNPIGTLKYNLAVSNGHKIDADNSETKINMNADDNKNKVFLGSLNYELNFLWGVGIGASYLSQKLNGYTAAGGTIPTVDLNQQIVGYDIYYDMLPAQFIAEYYSITNEDTLSSPKISYNANGYFVQAAYEFQETFRPYIRYEEVNPADNDPFTTSLNLNKIKRTTYGIRYNLALESSLKLEGITETKNNETYTIVGFQWAFTF